jgi:hypothetical protein
MLDMSRPHQLKDAVEVPDYEALASESQKMARPDDR